MSSPILIFSIITIIPIENLLVESLVLSVIILKHQLKAICLFHFVSGIARRCSLGSLIHALMIFVLFPYLCDDARKLQKKKI